MLNKSTYLVIVIYFLIYYGQNVFPFGSEIRSDYYFIGMSLMRLLISFILFKSIKNSATSFYLFLCVGDSFNEMFSGGLFYSVEIVFGVVGWAYIMLKDKIKWSIKK